jgi:hypothetical protein
LNKIIANSPQDAAVHRLATWSNKGIEMRLFAVLAAVSALSQPAFAQTPDCKSISDSAARLTCYDKKAPPASAAAKPGPASADSAKYVVSSARKMH